MSENNSLPQRQIDAKHALDAGMTAREISMSALANRLGYSYTYIWQLARGKAPIKDAFVGALVRGRYWSLAREIVEALNQTEQVPA